MNPNNRQRGALARSAGCARFAYNWGLDQRIKAYQSEKKSLTAIDQHKILCALKKTEYPWMYEVSKCAPQEALRDLDKAFKNFFRRLKQGGKPGFPRFKSKHKKSSFRTYGAVYVTAASVKLPMIKGSLRLKDKGYIPVEGVKYNSFTVSKEAGRWFLSVQCIVDMKENHEPRTDVIGVDVGIKNLAVASNGTVFPNPKSYNKLERALNRVQREKARRKKGSQNRKKSIYRLQKIHYKIACARKDNIHKMTSLLAKTKPRVIVLEDLSVGGMLKNHKLAKAISDASFGEIRRQLEYKSKWYGSEIVITDRFFPSSKMCSRCGALKEDLTLADRTYRCDCGLEIDRDLNAAMNLKRYGEFHRSLSNQKACGEERLQSDSVTGVGRCSSEKQEFNNRLAPCG